MLETRFVSFIQSVMRLCQHWKLLVVDLSIPSSSPHHAEIGCVIIRSHAEPYMFTESLNAWSFVSTLQWYSGQA